MRGSHVIFCTGSLQNPHNPRLCGEDDFAGSVVLGLGSAVNDLDFAGKTVVVVGMGAFAIENARLAMLSGVKHVHMVARTRVGVTARFTRVLNILSSSAFYHPHGEGRGEALPPFDRRLLMDLQYAVTGADAAKPDNTDASSTPWTTSDIFFLGHALGRLTVHKGSVDRLTTGMAMVKLGDDGQVQIPCDVVVKNMGFSGVDVNDKMGGVCEVVGHRTCHPPIWITDRVLTFRHQTDLPRDLPRQVADRLGTVALQQELEDLDLDMLRRRAKSLGLDVSRHDRAPELRQRLFERQHRAQPGQLMEQG
jgi:hypothetical protein